MLSKIERILIAELWASSILIAAGTGFLARTALPTCADNSPTAVVRSWTDAAHHLGNAVCKTENDKKIAGSLATSSFVYGLLGADAGMFGLVLAGRYQKKEDYQ